MSAVIELQNDVDGGLTVLPLQPTIGAEISGVDLRQPLAPSVRDQIKATLLQYKVVFFRDQVLTRDQHEGFASAFGPLYTHPVQQPASAENSPALHRISAEYSKEEARELDDRGVRQARRWDPYHIDTTWRLAPTWGSVLRAITVPEVGGDTVWVDAGLAYRALPKDVREQLDGLYVTHDYRAQLRRLGQDYPIVSHPVVKVHPETGERVLQVSFGQGDAPDLLGLGRAESEELLTAVLDQYRRPEHQVRFQWRSGSLAFWDNRAVVHYAVRNYGDFPRVLERILIADEHAYTDL